jgi:hypothetical protein
MSKLTDAVLNGNGVATDSPGFRANLIHGGQFGWSTRLGKLGADGAAYEEWISSQAYVKRNVIPFVLQAPKIFNYLPESNKWISTYKALMELHAEQITGLNSGLTVETDEHAIGGAGEQMEEPTKVTRARTQLNYVWREKSGKAISKFLDIYIRYGIADPDTDTALIGLMSGYTPDLYTPDYYSGSIIFVEPDVTSRYVVDAWLCVNVFPKGNGDITAGRVKTAPGETQEISVDMSSITMYGDSVRKLGQTMLDQLNVSAVDPSDAVIATTMNPLVADNNTETGFIQNSALNK